MIEIPESKSVASQLKNTVAGKHISSAAAAHSPHKFAWYQGDPQDYPAMLAGKTIEDAYGFGSHVEFKAGEDYVAVSEGSSWRYHENLDDLPAKHQLLLAFTDGSALCLTVRMYGGIFCFKQGAMDNEYYLMAKQKPSPLSEEFDRAYFDALLAAPKMEKLSAKAFLATEQRIPGLGNGSLQDILFNARVHPKRKVGTLSSGEKQAMFDSVKKTLTEMAAKGGRDTETDLFGQPGGYATRCSKHTVGKPCAVCGTPIVKASYMGGSVYFCSSCQPL